MQIWSEWDFQTAIQTYQACWQWCSAPQRGSLYRLFIFPLLAHWLRKKCLYIQQSIEHDQAVHVSRSNIANRKPAYFYMCPPKPWLQGEITVLTDLWHWQSLVWFNQVLCSVIFEGLVNLWFSSRTFRPWLLMGCLSRSHFETFFQSVSELMEPFSGRPPFNPQGCRSFVQIVGKLSHLMCSNYTFNFGSLLAFPLSLSTLMLSCKVEKVNVLTLNRERTHVCMSG